MPVPAGAGYPGDEFKKMMGEIDHDLKDTRIAPWRNPERDTQGKRQEDRAGQI